MELMKFTFIQILIHGDSSGNGAIFLPKIFKSIIIVSKNND